MGPTQNAFYVIPSCALWRRLSSASLSVLNASPPRNAFPDAFKKFFELTTQIISPGSAVAARPLYDILEMLEPLWQEIANKTEDWPLKFSALLDKLQPHGFCSLKPGETILFNQQEFLWNSNQDAPAQDWVGCVVGYAVEHPQVLGCTRETSCVCAVQV